MTYSLGDKFLGSSGPDFEPDQAGLLSGRSAYNNRRPGFAYLATDANLLFFRQGEPAGGWSSGITFYSGGGEGSGSVTNLSYDADTRLLSSSDGSDVTLPLGTALVAGLLAPADFTLLRSALQPGDNSGETVFEITDGASVVISPANGALQTWTLGASRTPTATFPEGASTTLHITAGSFTIDWASIGVTWLTGNAPVLATSGVTPITLYRVDGVIYGAAPVDVTPFPRNIANGTAALGTSAISSGSSASVVTVSAAGVLTTDVVDWGFNANPNSVTGYSAASTSGCLVITAYPTANNVNFLVSNPTAGSITPGALTLNWRVRR